MRGLDTFGKVLVTGAGGFIGRPSVRMLANRGYEVHAVSRDEPSPRARADCPQCVWHRADLLDSSQLTTLLAAVKPDRLLHLAWYAVPGKYWSSPENFRWVQASLDLLHQFQRHGGQRIVTAGSCAEYEWGSDLCHETETARRPATVYGKCKHHLQELQDEFARVHRLSSAWGRVFFLHGPNEAPSRLVASVARSLIRGEAADCSHGRQVRDFLYVDDVAEAFVNLLAGETEGPVNIASGEQATIAEVVTTLAEIVGRPDLIRLGARPAAPNDPPVLLADVTRLRTEVGWRPRFTRKQGLERSLEYWQRHVAGERQSCD